LSIGVVDPVGSDTFAGFGSGKIIPETDSLKLKKTMQDPDLKPKVPSKSDPDPEPKTVIPDPQRWL
jgi:hypothetical protein